MEGIQKKNRSITTRPCPYTKTDGTSRGTYYLNVIPDEMNNTTIALLELAHWDEVSKIFKQGIDTGNSTFETKIPEWEQFDSAHHKKCRIVAIKSDSVVGWGAISPTSSRKVYSGVGEVSVYVRNDYKGQGIGRLLLEKLIILSEEEGFWTLQTGVFPENESSIFLHKILGFQIVGVRQGLGKHNGVWRDVVLMEKRSNVIN